MVYFLCYRFFRLEIDHKQNTNREYQDNGKRTKQYAKNAVVEYNLFHIVLPLPKVFSYGWKR